MADASDASPQCEMCEVMVVGQLSGELVASIALPTTSTIAAVKRSVRATKGVYEEQQKLMMGTTVLSEDECLASLELTAGQLSLGLVILELELWTLRYSDLQKLGVEDLVRDCSPFGNLVHVHHIRGGSESFVVFASQAAAEAAEAALASTSSGRPESCAALAEQGVDYGGAADYWPNLINLLLCMTGAVKKENGLESLLTEAQELLAREASQQDVAALLLQLVPLLDESAVKDASSLKMWTTTMAMFAAGTLSQHVDRFADTSVNEFLHCLDTTKGNLANAWAETE